MALDMEKLRAVLREKTENSAEDRRLEEEMFAHYDAMRQAADERIRRHTQLFDFEQTVSDRNPEPQPVRISELGNLAEFCRPPDRHWDWLLSPAQTRLFQTAFVAVMRYGEPQLVETDECDYLIERHRAYRRHRIRVKQTGEVVTTVYVQVSRKFMPAETPSPAYFHEPATVEMVPNPVIHERPWQLVPLSLIDWSQGKEHIEEHWVGWETIDHDGFAWNGDLFYLESKGRAGP